MDNRRSTPSSRGSGRGLTPLPQVKPTKSAVNMDRLSNKGSNSLLSMQEVQRRAQAHEKRLLRSGAFDGSKDYHIQENLSSVQMTDGKKKGQKRKKNEMMSLLEAQERMVEISHSRGLGKKSLPGIGQTSAEQSCSSGKLPKIQKKAIVENNTIDIITRHEASVRTAAKIKEISEEYMKAAASDIGPQFSNNAPELIALNEEKVGRAYRGMSYEEYAMSYEPNMRLDKVSRSPERRRSPKSPGSGY